MGEIDFIGQILPVKTPLMKFWKIPVNSCIEQNNKKEVFAGWIVDGIKINGNLHGGNGGNKTVIHLNPGDKVSRIYGTRCRSVYFNIYVEGPESCNL